MTRRNGCTQDVLVLPETAGVEITRFEADDLYAADHERPGAWELDFGQQAKNARTGQFIQVLSVLSKKPVKIYKGKTGRTSQSTTTIASNAQDKALTFLDRRKAKNGLVLWLGIFLLSLVLLIGIIVLVNMGNNTAAASTALAVPIVGRVLSRRLVKTEDVETADQAKAIARKETGTVLSIVIAEETGTWDYHNINRNLVPAGATEREFKGEPFYLLGLTPQGELWSIEPDRNVEEGETPLDLYLALDYEAEVDELIGLDRSVLEKIKIGILVGLSVGVLIVFFLVIMTAMGGTTVG